MAMTLYLFVLLLIYLYAYKEELSGFISKIFKTIKNFALNIWGKLNSTKKLIRAFAIFAGLSLLLLLIYNIIENSILHSEKIRNLPEGFNFSLKSNELSEIQNIRKSTFFYTSGALLVALLLTLSFTKRLKLILQEHILRIFVLTVVFGGVLSFFIPAFLYNYGFIGETKDLTTALFTITGGTIALFSLIKSHQKSELEREQLDTQKQKDARDHIRQLHNSYNDRFDKAVAELNGSDVKASYTAVPKLAKLADAWLDYKDLSNDTKELEKLKDKAEKEAQTIINILCKYIRTIPNNYTHEQLKEFKSLPESDIEILTHEVDIRRLIFSEISKRSSTFTRDGFGKIIDTYTGTWSDFEFDFSRAPIFYPLSSLTIEKGNFSSAKFYSNADFSGATFTQTADFSKATFTQNANFSWATFTQTADFESATFTQTARFHVTKFTQDANFRWATFTQTANFRSATFTQTANFRSATFERFEPTFATKLGKARFSAGTSPQNYMFSVAPDSKPINCKPATLLGKTFIIPLGTVLFDPDSPPKDHLGNYTVQSASAE
ncbi:hypothetical protein HMPREF2630_00620 [Rothia sp. HMSC072B03]|nr:hypothetical protein HMPREF2630_00620 [Rothia sp. HMSC072B03]